VSEDIQENQLHRSSVATRLNWLRAGVLGANDGLISTAGLVVGVAAASTDIQDITTAGIAGLIAGAISMALGEFVSVSTQRDTEKALITKKKSLLKAHPNEGREWIVSFLRERGVSKNTSNLVIAEFNDEEVLHALLRHGFGINEQEIVNPWVAAGSSMLSFSFGAALPVIAMQLSPADLRIPVTVIAVLIGLAITGGLSAYLGQASKRSAVMRLICGGALAMAITYGIGQLLGTTVF
jgi:VIT1/CCC1 family predicted Fe2+/Mn2+ transporter